jgi:DNA replication protein DnaC
MENNFFDNKGKDIAKKQGFCHICGFMLAEDGFCKGCKQKEERDAYFKAIAERETKELYERFGGEKNYKEFTAERYDNKELLGMLSEYPCKNFYLYGNSGNGKTHLAVATARRLDYFLLAKPSELFRQIRKREPLAEDAQIEKIGGRIPLIIDDVGIERLDASAAQFFYEILDARMSSKKNGLIITTNFSPIELGKRMATLGDTTNADERKIMADRVISRIADLCEIIKIDGEDRRVVSAMERIK